MIAQYHIDTPLPEDLAEGDPALTLSALWMDLAFRKINAMYESRAELPLVITKSDSGFLFSLIE